jgi:hypothetical protein
MLASVLQDRNGVREPGTYVKVGPIAHGLPDLVYDAAADDRHEHL